MPLLILTIRRLNKLFLCEISQEEKPLDYDYLDIHSVVIIITDYALRCYILMQYINFIITKSLTDTIMITENAFRITYTHSTQYYAIIVIINFSLIDRMITKPRFDLIDLIIICVDSYLVIMNIG